MKRKIIKIDREKCDGCGLCIPDCPEGALQIIDGKATLISDLFCDGLGACIGTCPTGAIEVEEREAEPYDEIKVMANIVKQGPNVILAHLNHLRVHNEAELLNQALQYLSDNEISLPPGSEFESLSCMDSPGQQGGGCPGAAMRDLRGVRDNEQPSDLPRPKSVLQNWPVQLKLLNPHAPYLREAEILIAADCVPFAFADFHQRFLKGKVMITFCPKLDTGIEDYIEKLATIFKDNAIKSISVVHMEVPCCSGTVHILQQALQKSEKIIPIKDYTISISGEII
jgi:ferredoxin